VTARPTELKDRRIGELVTTLTAEGKTLIRQEIALLKAELRERETLVRRDLDDRRELLETDVRRDLQRARMEASDNGALLARGAGMIAGAAMVGLVVMILLAALVVRLFAYAMPLAAAIAVTLAIFAAVAVALALFGRRLIGRAAPLVRQRTVDDLKNDIRRLFAPGRLAQVATPPEHTIETVKEDVEWLKHPRRSEAR
jgi:putative superfamily III holin-X